MQRIYLEIYVRKRYIQNCNFRGNVFPMHSNYVDPHTSYRFVFCPKTSTYRLLLIAGFVFFIPMTQFTIPIQPMDPSYSYFITPSPLHQKRFVATTNLLFSAHSLQQCKTYTIRFSTATLLTASFLSLCNT